MAKKQESIANSNEKLNKINKNCPWKRTDSDISDKDFKITVLQMLKELKDDVEKVEKMIYGQSQNSNREKT